jgi:hypothetical protein
MNKRRLIPLVVLALLAGCEGRSPTEPVPPPPAAPPTFLSVENLLEGDTAVLRGTRLSVLESLAVDGVIVPFERVDSSTVRFAVPRLRDCGVDGRIVTLRGNADLRLDSPLRVPTLRMEIGEVRELSAADLACVRLPAEVHDYSLLVLNTRITPSFEDIGRLRVLTPATEGDAPPRHALGINVQSHPEGLPSSYMRDEQPPTGWTSPPRVTSFAAAAANPKLFDPRLASAQVGDTLRVWDSMGSLDQFNPTVIEAKVLAVHGKHVILVDRASVYFDRLDTPEIRAKLHESAGVVDRWMMPALRGVYDPALQVLPGAGGRHFTLLRDMRVAGQVNVKDARPRSVEPLSSEIMMAFYGTEGAFKAGAPAISRVILHEMGHVAEVIQRNWLGKQPARAGISEAFAEMVPELAFRMESNQPTGARYDRTRHAVEPGYHHEMGMGRYEWEGLGDIYGTLSSMTLFVAERLGNNGINGSGPSLYQRLQQLDAQQTTVQDAWRVWGIRGLATLLDMTPEELLRTYALAVATDERVAGDHARLRGLPQLDSWSLRFPFADGRPAAWINGQLVFTRIFDAPRGGWVDMRLGHGGHVAWYIRGEPGKGHSLIVDQRNPDAPSEFRLVRLR